MYIYIYTYMQYHFLLVNFRAVVLVNEEHLMIPVFISLEMIKLLVVSLV